MEIGGVPWCTAVFRISKDLEELKSVRRGIVELRNQEASSIEKQARR